MTAQEQAAEMLALSRQRLRRIWIKNKKHLGMNWKDFFANLQVTAKGKDAN
jgi:hypothetical protein